MNEYSLRYATKEEFCMKNCQGGHFYTKATCKFAVVSRVNKIHISTHHKLCYSERERSRVEQDLYIFRQMADDAVQHAFEIL